jgi:transcriptional regulator NrdR family protein
MKVTVFKDLFKTDVPFIVPIEKIIDRIKEGTSKNLIEKIRVCTSKDERNSLKKKLPAIIFSGEFRERHKNGLISHSGLMITDFDNFPNNDVYDDIFKQITSNKHTVLAFESPSGNGIKAVIRIPKCNKDDHEKYFKAFKKEFQYKYFDESNCDISRVCFESYDPNIYINLDAEIYSPKLIDKGFENRERPPLIPITNEDEIIERIMNFDWGKDFFDGQKNNYIFDLAGAFCEYGISESTCINYLESRVFGGACADERGKINTIKSAYKKRQFDSKYFENWDRVNNIKVDLKRGKEEVIKKYQITEQVFEEIKDNTEHEDFWYLEYDKKGNEKVKVDPFKYKNFLERNGHKKYFHNDSQKPTWVKINSNRIHETSVEKIKDFVLNHLLEKKEIDVWRYCVNYQNMFSEPFLLMLETIELMMLDDTQDKSYIAFENGILEVDKDNEHLIDYIDIDGYIWESQIIHREYKVLDNFYNEYQQFILNISNNEPTAIECVIGYLLHGYKNKMNNKAIILNDEVISENPEGGTGKGLFIQGLRQIRKVSILDGKTFDDKKSFPYQTVTPETQILVFDDVKKNWDFESKFSLVTEGMTLERKNKDAIKLTVQESPKMVISTNYAIKGEGNSHDRRRHEIEIAQYYGKYKTPYDEFGKQLFDDWQKSEFVAFDNYMVHCLRTYLKLGLVHQNAKNLKTRKFIAETSMEFLQWIEEKGNFPFDIRNEKNLYLEYFIKENKDFKDLKTRTFSAWVKKYANFKELKYTTDRSNGVAWFQIDTPDQDIEIIEEDIF